MSDDKQKAAAFEWLRREALLGNKRAEYILKEIKRLRAATEDQT